MSDLLNGLTTTALSWANWTHRSVKEIPVAGPMYTLFCDKVAVPLRNAAVVTKDYATPHFQDIRGGVESQVRKHPIISGSIAAIGVVILVRRLYNHYFPSKP